MNLHSFSSRGSGVCRSLFLRTFMVMMLFITGSNGIYAGEDLKATLSTPASHGKWDSNNKQYSWDLIYDNLMPIFTGLKGKLNTAYVALKFTTSDYTSQYRVCFMNGSVAVKTVTLESAGEQTIELSKLGDLSQVDNIKFGGNSNKGSITLAPNTIVLVGQSKITVSPNDPNKGTVYFTVGNDAAQYTSRTVPNHTSVKFYASPKEKMVFTGWGGVDGKGRFVSPTEVKDVTKDLEFIANFVDGIHIECTVDPSNAAEPDVYQKGHPDWKMTSDGYVAQGQATTFAFKNKQERYNFLGWYDETGKELTKETTYSLDQINEETKVIARFSHDIKEINEERTITVDGKTRRYWLYVPASLEGSENVPVVFSLHGRYGKDKPTDEGKPVFTSLANKEGFIVVYPQGRDAGSDQDKADYPGDWYNSFGGGTGWEATGKENADTKFIKALVEKIQSDYKTKNASNNNISVNPKRFYLCGFSMGGMMTYACAKVLNGTFAAYGSCGGFPLNEFHMNLATENPIPFIHLHGTMDNMLGIKHLNTIIENLLFRNGCDLSGQKASLDKPWSNTKENGETHPFKKFDFIGVKGVPVTTVTFNGLWHSVEASAPAYLWNFFSDKTNDMYKSDIEWKWDMPTINANIEANSSNGGNVNAFTYGWKHVINGKDRSLTYGGEGKTECKISECTSAKEGCNGNHNVYNSIQLTPGKHTLYAQMKSTSGESSVTLRNILTGAETVARKIDDNSGTHDATTYNVLYEFEVGEGAEFSLELKRSDTNSACTLLEIHKGSYSPQGVKDESEDGATVHLDDGKLAELTFENVDIDSINSGYGADLTSEDGNMKLYLKSRLGVNKGTIDNVKKYIVEDPVFGHYFQNIPDADIYDRYGASDYMRVVLGEKNSLSGHDDIAGIQKTGKVTIGFWVNGDIAVNRGLAYDEPSMFYIAGNEYYGENQNNNPHMFNITCNGGLSGYMNGGAVEYHSGASSFGGLCPGSKEDFYSKNFYKDCNWHYITYQMYDNLSRYNMYVDGEPTCLGGYATHKAQSLDECISGLKSIVLGGANANNVKFAYDVAFAYDDIVIYNRVLSKREINKIIEDKKYSPSVWHFDRNLGNKIFFNPAQMDPTMWTSSDGSYTLNTNFTSAAALTYDGITEIPAFKGLRFVTNGGQKIKIDAKSGALQLSQGVKVVFSNLKEGTYVRMEYKKENNVNWEGLTEGITISKMVKPLNIPSPSDGCTRQAFKVMKAETGEENSITMPSAIDIIRMEATNKNFAQIVFVDKKTKQKVTVVRNPANDDALPDKNLYVNTTERLNPLWDGTSYNFKYTSSSPHVASIDADGKVTLHGIAGSTVITAELINDKNLYDCDIYDQYAFEPSNRIFSSYEIVVDPKHDTFYKVADGKTYTVGQTLYNGDKTVGVTLGGWTYNNGSYYNKYQDSYSAKEPWEGQKFEKNADRNGYLANSRKTEEDVFHEFFNDEDKDGKYKKETFSTNGSHAAKSEQLTKDYAATGNYSAPADNKSVANATPWLLPCRGSHIKIEPTDAGLISVYVMQEGCVSHAPSGGEEVGGVHYDEDEPIDVTVKKVYVADEKGEIVKEVVADTKSKVAAQMHKDDGRARAEYFWGSEGLAYNKATMESFLKINDDDKWSFLDNWPNPGMQQHVFKLGKDEDGHVLITKGIVRYTFNVLQARPITSSQIRQSSDWQALHSSKANMLNIIRCNLTLSMMNGGQQVKLWTFQKSKMSCLRMEKTILRLLMQRMRMSRLIARSTRTIGMPSVCLIPSIGDR